MDTQQQKRFWSALLTGVFFFLSIHTIHATSVSEKAAEAGKDPSSQHASMILVLDASGSMWGQIKGKAKIAIAKEVMVELINKIPADFRTGLTVYGHRRKGDCADIEMMLPPGPHNPGTMKRKIQTINPKGKTPLSDAVKQAAEALKFTEEKATVVLVSDGLETCHQDPCGLAERLAMTGVDFTIHVVGFDVSKGDQERLRCLADKTGGLFLSANNAGSLKDALFKTVEKIKEPPPPVVEDPGTASLTAPEKVSAGSPFKVTWEGPDSKGDYIAISLKDTEDLDHREYRYTKMGNPVQFKAPGETGLYELRYIHWHTKKVIGKTLIDVTPVEASVTVPASAKAASRFEVTWQGPDYAGDYITIAKPDEPATRYLTYRYTNNGSPLQMRAPAEPGMYEIRYIMSQDTVPLAKTTITIEPTDATVQVPESAPVATQFEVTWTGPDNHGDYISIARLDQRSNQYLNYTYTSKGNPISVWAPSEPGRYEVRYMQNLGHKMLASVYIEITPVTASIQVPVNTQAGSRFEVGWAGPDYHGDYISIARNDQRDDQYIHYTYTSKGTPLKIQAPVDPGNYKVMYILGKGRKVLAKSNIVIDPVTASIQGPASAAPDSVIEVTWNGPGYKGDYISIALPEQKSNGYKTYSYLKGNPVKIKVPKQAGKYEIRYIMALKRTLLARSTLVVTP